MHVLDMFEIAGALVILLVSRASRPKLVTPPTNLSQRPKDATPRPADLHLRRRPDKSAPCFFPVLRGGC